MRRSQAIRTIKDRVLLMAEQAAMTSEAGHTQCHITRREDGEHIVQHNRKLDWIKQEGVDSVS